MLPDPQRAAAAAAWLRKAASDIRYAQIDLDAAPPGADDAVFHCQQSVETALKTFLFWHDQPFPKSHEARSALN